MSEPGDTTTNTRPAIGRIDPYSGVNGEDVSLAPESSVR
jgi:hypothetical protein